MRLATATALLLLAPGPGAQDKILYPKARFDYSWPKAALETQRHENAWLRQSAVPGGSIRELHTWPVPTPESRLETFTDGPHVVYTSSPKYDGFSVHFASFVAAVSEADGHAFKIEAGHHRTAVWGCVHAWKHYEWGGDGESIPEDWPAQAMYEHVFTGIESGKGVFAKTHAFRVSHVRVGGAGEEFIGEISDYLGAGKDAVGRTGLQFRRWTINFAVDVSARGPRPVVTWHRGGRAGGWRQDSVHGIGHMKDWHTKVDEIHASPPQPKPRESELFCLLGSKKRGLQPARVASILDYRGWAKRRKSGKRPQHLLVSKGRRTKSGFQPKLAKRTGFVKAKGKGFVFVCKELGLNVKLDVPEDLVPLLAAWVENFPR